MNRYVVAAAVCCVTALAAVYVCFTSITDTDTDDED